MSKYKHELDHSPLPPTHQTQLVQSLKKSPQHLQTNLLQPDGLLWRVIVDSLTLVIRDGQGSDVRGQSLYNVLTILTIAVCLLNSYYLLPITRLILITSGEFLAQRDRTLLLHLTHVAFVDSLPKFVDDG